MRHDLRIRDPTSGRQLSPSPAEAVDGDARHVSVTQGAKSAKGLRRPVAVRANPEEGSKNKGAEGPAETAPQAQRQAATGHRGEFGAAAIIRVKGAPRGGES